ncbi:aminotransferase class III-fold pyridoxal phosphate-dependent enzyme [Pseudodesulfovibrio sp. JC047]|uniref:aminotransferase class III-fold pyridoxal phosphate-dependent enzyme n=1 Tax=Pseudodesulfovibrio sp. JC047 TaxID=2683199 RepID=UPI001406E5A6|nr:aminotransferase class III-fold pyridoxal phosphate-dependent enzyme [Pseudodesulfovibrio sp. JC047]NDV20641.1 aminotransferase class III-fold pyridoxal phosphate-dependent enzyme [Pseudodesulfovibrio sp. JC047]
MSRNNDMQQRAASVIPGMTQLLSKRPDQFSLGAWPGYFSKASGATVRDLDGTTYLDMSIGGIGATILGYANPEVDAAVLETVKNGVASSLNCPEEVLLAERLCDIHGWADMVRLTRSGGEAMAVAVRIARTATRRSTIAFCGYHGWHDWYLAANLRKDSLGGHLLHGLDAGGVPQELAGTARPFTYNHPEKLDRIIDETNGELAAIVMEPMRSTRPDPGFLDHVAAQAKKCGAVLIFDEISAGFRLGLGGAHAFITSVTPDMAVFAKAMGNGYPIAAVIGTRSVMNEAQNSFISSTNWTERIGPTAALATLDILERDMPFEELGRLGRAVKQIWQTAATTHGLDISIGGMDPMGHFQFAEQHDLCKALFVEAMLERGILASSLFYAMSAHTEAHIQRYAEATDAAFKQVATALQSDDPAKQLHGAPAASGFTRLA